MKLTKIIEISTKQVVHIVIYRVVAKSSLLIQYNIKNNFLPVLYFWAHYCECVDLFEVSD